MQRGEKRRLLKTLLIVLVIFVLLVGIYFGYRTYVNWRGSRNLFIFEQGATYGYTQAVLQIINISDACKSFPIYVGNETRELISVTCFK